MLSKKTSLFLFYNMLRIRMIEETIAELYREQEMRCPVHLCTGQEAVAAGVCAHLRKNDYCMSNHRSHGHYLAKGGDLKQMLAEIYGKATGCSKGKGGSMHLADLKRNFLGSTPIVASTIPVAVGLAFGARMQASNNLTVVFFGDAATEEGAFFESLNFAALKKLSIIFICENNFYSVYTPLDQRQPKKRNNTLIAKAFGIYSRKGDGNDILAIYRLAREAVKRVRGGRGPCFLQFDTYRIREHCGPDYDNNLGYRSEAEFKKWLKRCPLESYKIYLLKKGIIKQQQIDELKQKIQSEINKAIAFAKNSPYPEARQLLTGLYA